MLTQTVTAKGQVTLRRELLRHLGIKPGDRVSFDKTADGKIELSAAKPQGSIEDFFGCLAGKTDKVATLEEINDAIEAGWAGQV